MLRIGLTGGIGSGKTTVANLFSRLGIDVIDADEIVHQISAPGQLVHEKIISQFGDKFLNQDGTLNRKLLGEIIQHSLLTLFGQFLEHSSGNCNGPWFERNKSVIAG